jgi:predicted RNase H-like HicB family nuclease
MGTVNKYRVQYDRDVSGWWIATVPDVQGCRTQGRTLAEARKRIREALSLYVEHAATATLEDDVRMPAAIKRAVRDYRSARDKAEKEQVTASLRARNAVKLLAGPKLKLSRRDAAEVVGLSPQRVQQLLDSQGA